MISSPSAFRNSGRGLTEEAIQQAETCKCIAKLSNGLQTWMVCIQTDYDQSVYTPSMCTAFCSLHRSMCCIYHAEGDQTHSNASLCLTLPGCKLHLSALLTLWKSRKRGDRKGTLAGFRAYKSAKLGMIESINPKRDTSVVSCLNVHHCLHIQILLTESY